MTIGGVARAACPELYRCYAKARPQAELLWGRASRVLGGAVGHDLRLFQPVPMYIAKGLGSRKWDIDGNEYIDYLMGNGALLLGHAHPAVRGDDRSSRRWHALRAGLAAHNPMGGDDPRDGALG